MMDNASNSSCINRGDGLIKKIEVEKYIDHRPRLAWIMAVNGMVKELKK